MRFTSFQAAPPHDGILPHRPPGVQCFRAANFTSSRETGSNWLHEHVAGRVVAAVANSKPVAGFAVAMNIVARMGGRSELLESLAHGQPDQAIAVSSADSQPAARGSQSSRPPFSIRPVFNPAEVFCDPVLVSAYAGLDAVPAGDHCNGSEQRKTPASFLQPTGGRCRHLTRELHSEHRAVFGGF